MTGEKPKTDKMANKKKNKTSEYSFTEFLKGMRDDSLEMIYKSVIDARNDKKVTDKEFRERLELLRETGYAEGRAKMHREFKAAMDAGIHVITEHEKKRLKSKLNPEARAVADMLEGIFGGSNLPSDDHIIENVEGNTCEGCPSQEECKERYDKIKKTEHEKTNN